MSNQAEAPKPSAPAMRTGDTVLYEARGGGVYEARIMSEYMFNCMIYSPALGLISSSYARLTPFSPYPQGRPLTPALPR